MHDHDIAVIGIAIGRGATGQAGIGCLHDHDHARLDAGLQHTPLLHQRPRHDNRQRAPLTKTETPAIGQRRPIFGQHMMTAHDLLEFRNQLCAFSR